MASRLYSGDMGGIPTLIPRVVYLTTSATPGTPLQMVPQVVGSASSDGVATTDKWGNAKNTATFTATHPHGLRVGMSVTISGAADTRFNGSFLVASVTNETVFTFLIAPGSVTTQNNLTGTYTCQFQRATLRADDNNTSNISFGANSQCDFDYMVPKQSYDLECPTGAKKDLADYWFKSTGASQVMRIEVT